MVDHRHSPADVAAGAILGAVVAPYWLARVIVRDFTWLANPSQVPRRLLHSESLEAATDQAPLLDSEDSDTEPAPVRRKASSDGL